MRKIFALAMVAVLSLTIGLAVMGCGQKAEQAESTPPAEQSTTPADSGSSMMSDSGMSNMADTTAHK
jgi:hypothetical protein